VRFWEIDMLASLLAAAIARCPATEEAAECYSDEFIAGQINSHLKAIALYENEASNADARRRATAQTILPQLHRHLAMLESLQSADGHHRTEGRHRDVRVGRRS
jgi:hypothetical protein